MDIQAALAQHFQETKDLRLKELFDKDADRFDNLHLEFDGLLFDFSKNRITNETLPLLVQLATEANLAVKIEELFSGAKVNTTEDRAVLHTALRSEASELMVGEQNVMAEIEQELARMKVLSSALRNGQWRGATGQVINTVVNIGIGGSHLGPQMVTAALSSSSNSSLKVMFVSNIDGANFSEIQQNCDPATTLFFISSKSFTTQETLTNAQSAVEWLQDSLKTDRAQTIAAHFIAITANLVPAVEWGVHPDNVLTFGDYVGGRFSLWSTIGFPIMCQIGYESFVELLAGAHSTDLHFRTQPFAQNIPVIMALLTYWYTKFFATQTQAVIPYSHQLRMLPSYLQQAEMESNGKCIDRNGNKIDYPTAPVIWGEAGTNAQHSFIQLLHQGTHLIPVDFIGFIQPLSALPNHHQILTANMLAQSEALMMGKDDDNPHKFMPGNKPSSTFLFDKLTPYSLGKLIALYEHKIFTLGVLWNINSFDQWGVELGKKLARQIESELTDGIKEMHDSSTQNLIYRVLSQK